MFRLRAWCFGWCTWYFGTGWYSTTVFHNLFLTDKKLINCKTQPFSSSLYIDILIFWCLSMVRWTKSCIPQHCQNIVISLSKLISTGLSTQTHLWTYMCTTDIPKYHRDNPKHHSSRGGRYILIIHFYIESGQKIIQFKIQSEISKHLNCLLYTSDAADE